MTLQRLDLNGSWEFVADLDPKYHAVHGGFHLPGANRRDWLKVPVPGVWQKYAERYDIFEGVCWFAREFEVAELAESATARLRFGAVNYLANVYLNGEHIGSHEGGYTEFVLDATGKLKAGVNHLAVQADNRATTIKWPPCLGYFNYGGMHRGVTLEIAAGPWLDDLRIEAVPDAQGGRLRVSGQVISGPFLEGERPREPFRDCVVRVQVAAAEVRVSINSDGSFRSTICAPGIEPWSPENPVLYPVEITLAEDGSRGRSPSTGVTVHDAQKLTCGFRRISMSDGRVQLNGRPLPLKGICYVYDSPMTGLVMTPEQIKADLRLMKDAGCNAVRCHYPMDPLFYDACDRLGLLVWIEPPVYCYHPGDGETRTRFADAAWLGLAQQMAREMIAVARNHPSVAIYSIGNECNTHNPEAEAFFRQLAATIRAEDPTRLLSYAALYGIIGPIADLVDVLGINSYYGWYDQIRQDGTDKDQGSRGEGRGSRGEGQGTEDAAVQQRAIDLTPMRQMLDEVLARKSKLALLLTEFGADAVPGFHSRSHALWSEEYHAELLRAVLALAGEYPQIIGTFPFCFSDYRDPSKVHNGYWNELNLKGIVTYARRRKLGFTALRESYASAERCRQ